MPHQDADAVNHFRCIKVLFLYAKKKSSRQKKVSDVIKQEIAQSLSRKDMYDPILVQMFITVLYVDISPDLRNATVKVSFLEDKYTQKGLSILNKLAYKYRKILAKKLTLRVMPQLKFATEDKKKSMGALDEIWQKIKILS